MPPAIPKPACSFNASAPLAQRIDHQIYSHGDHVFCDLIAKAGTDVISVGNDIRSKDDASLERQALSRKGLDLIH